jgi:hypothetical protein
MPLWLQHTQQQQLMCLAGAGALSWESSVLYCSATVLVYKLLLS